MKLLTMSGTQPINVTNTIHNHAMSPLTFSSEYSKVTRLILMVVCTITGTITNGFFITAFFVEDSLSRVGFVFLAMVGVADMMITTCIMPVSTVILLSGQWDNISVCKTLHFVTITSTYCYSLYFMLVAADNYYMYCKALEEYEVFISRRIKPISLLVFLISVVLAACGVFLALDYDYCERKNFGNFYFRIITMVLFHAIPGLVTIICMICASYQIRKRAQIAQFRRSLQYECDHSMNASNIAAYLLYVLGWLPYLFLVFEFPGTSDNKYYSVVLIGLFRSVVTSFMYGMVNNIFKRAYARLFNYCFCKTTLSSSYRGRRRQEYRRGDVKAHIIHQVIQASSPYRRSPAIQETRDL